METCGHLSMIDALEKIWIEWLSRDLIRATQTLFSTKLPKQAIPLVSCRSAIEIKVTQSRLFSNLLMTKMAI